MPEEKAQFLITNRPGESGLAGVVNNKLIPMNAFNTYVLDFLAYLAEMKFEYSTINSHRSANSAYNEKVDSKPTGQHLIPPHQNISGPYFHAFRLNTERYSEYGHFSRSIFI